MQALIALCSLSTSIISVFTLPSDTKLVNLCIISVAGVMGYAALTSGLTCLNASATASFPVTATILPVSGPSFPLLFHDNCLVPFLPRTLKSAYSAALAIVIIKPCHFSVLDINSHVRAVCPAEKTLNAVFLYPLGPVCPP